MRGIRKTLVCSLLGLATGVGAEDVPTFAEDVAPILYQNCVACHHEEGIAPFSFIEFEAVARRADQIAEVVEFGYMPPWKPVAGHGPALKGDRSLSKEDIETLIRWADAGAPAGDLALAPHPPDLSSGWELGEPDLVLELPESYWLEAEGSDRFRNFVLPLPIGARRFVRAFEFLPESMLAIHHASFALSFSSEEQSKDAADPGPGYDSFDIGDSVKRNGHIIGWTPGQVPYEVYPGTAWSIEPGANLVMQLHLLPTGKREEIRPKIGLHFTDEAPTLTTWVALLREYDIDIPAGAKNYEVEERFEIPVDVKALGLFPHAHYLGKDFRIFAELPDGERRWLLRIDDWDFNWQSDYTFLEPLELPAGSELVMQLSYDNSADNIRNPSNPPRRVQAGWGSYDEMAEVAIQLLLNDAKDQPKLEESAARSELQRPETEVQGWYNLAVALSAQGREREAIEAYDECVYLDPSFSRAWNNLGALYEERGNLRRALQLYERAVAEDAKQQEALLNLSRAYARENRLEESIGAAERLLRVNPIHFEGRRMLSVLYLKSGDASQAVTVLQAGLKWHGQSSDYLMDLVDAFGMSGDLVAARSVAETVVEADPQHGAAYIMLAAIGYQSGDRETGRRWMSRALQLPEASRPAVEALSEYLPFPDGILDLAQLLASLGQTAAALELLEQGKAFAVSQGRQDIADTLSQAIRVIRE